MTKISNPQRLYLLLLIGLLNACSSPLPATKLSDDQIRDQAFFYLKKRDTQKATPWMLALVSSSQKNSPKDSRLWAQYYLDAGMPRKAFEAIEKIENDEEKKLFKAVLFTLLGREPKAVVVPQKGLPQKKVNEIEHETYPLDSWEIWPDEWNSLKMSGKLNEFPVTEDIFLRQKLAIEVKSLIAKMRPETYALFPYSKPQEVATSKLPGIMQDQVKNIQASLLKKNYILFSPVLLKTRPERPPVLVSKNVGEVPFLLGENP